MATITKNRTIRPSSRQVKSSYRVDTKKVSQNDILEVNVDHETKPFRKSYTFSGSEVAYKNSIHFMVTESEDSITIRWSGATPNFDA